MVWPALILGADVPGPYFGCATAALAIRPPIRPTSAAAPRLLHVSISFPPVAFLFSFHGHPRLAHDRFVALAFGRDEVRELGRRAADRDAVLLDDHRAHLRCLRRAHRL